MVKQFGWSLAFAGRRVQQNSFTAEFVETTDTPMMRALYGWQDLCAGFKTPLGVPKAEYAINAKLVAKDTTGKYALQCALTNVWPKTITLTDFAEESSAMHVTVEFSLDHIDLLDVVTTSGSSSSNFDYDLPNRPRTRLGGYSSSPNGVSYSPAVASARGSLSYGSSSFGGFELAASIVAKIGPPSSVGAFFSSFF